MSPFNRSKGLSRRDFLRLSAGGLGSAAFAGSMRGLSTWRKPDMCWVFRRVKNDQPKLSEPMHMTVTTAALISTGLQPGGSASAAEQPFKRLLLAGCGGQTGWKPLKRFPPVAVSPHPAEAGC